jgi:hypothetical protein
MTANFHRFVAAAGLFLLGMALAATMDLPRRAMTEFWINIYPGGEIGYPCTDRGNCVVAGCQQAYRPIFRVHVRMKARP